MKIFKTIGNAFANFFSFFVKKDKRDERIELAEEVFKVLNKVGESKVDNAMAAVATALSLGTFATSANYAVTVLEQYVPTMYKALQLMNASDESTDVDVNIANITSATIKLKTLSEEKQAAEKVMLKKMMVNGELSLIEALTIVNEYCS